MRLNWFFNVLFSIQRHLRCSYRISNAIILLLPSDLLHGVFLTWLRRQQKNEWRGAGFFFFYRVIHLPLVSLLQCWGCVQVYIRATHLTDRPLFRPLLFMFVIANGPPKHSLADYSNIWWKMFVYYSATSLSPLLSLIWTTAGGLAHLPLFLSRFFIPP